MNADEFAAALASFLQTSLFDATDPLLFTEELEGAVESVEHDGNTVTIALVNGRRFRLRVEEA
ncbi:MAG: hypothetical protein M5R36_10905 [Deltaproteobacteria bacterium]|nr:hypothetical protein [Deltaproteobacteria bacterium]